jgi:hypothetical protein
VLTQFGLLNAITGAVSAALLFLAVARRTGSVPAATLSSALFAVTPSVWSSHAQAGVAPLSHALICAALFLSVSGRQMRHCLFPAVSHRARALCSLAHTGLSHMVLQVRLHDEGDATTVRWASFVSALVLTHSHSTALLCVPLLVLTFVSNPKAWLRLSTLSAGLVCFVLGLVPFAYIPLAAKRTPYVNFGNAATLEGFAMHVLGGVEGENFLRQRACSR